MTVATPPVFNATKEKRRRQRSVLEQAIGARLAELFEDPAIREIDVNCNGSVFVEKLGKDGGTHDTGIELDFAQAQNLVTNVAAEVISLDPGAVLDPLHPNLNGKLDYSEKEFVRVALTVPPNVEQPTIEIRKHSSIVIPLEQHVTSGMMTRAQYEGLCSLIDNRKNIVIVGAMFSGKTTMANGMLQRIGDVDPTRRYGFIEDVRELVCPLKNHKAVLATKAWSWSDIMPETLRWNLKSVTISELRSGIAANHLYNDLWLQGHDGGLTTFHAKNWPNMFWRTESLLKTAGFTPQRELLSSAINGVVVIQFDHVVGRKVTGVYDVDPELKDGYYNVTALGEELSAAWEVAVRARSAKVWDERVLEVQRAA